MPYPVLLKRNQKASWKSSTNTNHKTLPDNLYLRWLVSRGWPLISSNFPAHLSPYLWVTSSSFFSRTIIASPRSHFHPPLRQIARDKTFLFTSSSISKRRSSIHDCENCSSLPRAFKSLVGEDAQPVSHPLPHNRFVWLTISSSGDLLRFSNCWTWTREGGIFPFTPRFKSFLRWKEEQKSLFFCERFYAAIRLLVVRRSKGGDVVPKSHNCNSDFVVVFHLSLRGSEGENRTYVISFVQIEKPFIDDLLVI